MFKAASKARGFFIYRNYWDRGGIFFKKNRLLFSFQNKRSGAMQKYILLVFALFLSLAASRGFAAEDSKPKGTLIDLSVEASRAAPNDMARATAYVEASDVKPAELARRVNRTIASALETAKAYLRVKTRTGNTHTYPTYSKDGRISGWRMRAELLLESREMAVLSELLGKLQENLAIGQLTLLPAPETHRKTEDEATLEAITDFQAKASLVANALKKSYRILKMNIGSAGRPPIVPMMRASKMATMEAAPAPIEAGESMVSVSVSGQIELPLE
jgi:predicted secreted protein